MSIFNRKKKNKAKEDEDSINQEILNEEKKDMIQGVEDLSKTAVKEVMIPRIDVDFISSDTPQEELFSKIVASGHSRFPLYTESIDNVIGVLYVKDIIKCLAEKKPINLQELARKAYFVPESKRIDSLLREFKRHHLHIAIAIDEYGGMSGIVTMEDIIEEIVGDIMDEHDILEQNQKNETQVTKNKGGAIIIPGFLSIHDYNESYKPIIPEGEYETVAGFMIKMLSKMPQKGDEFVYNDYIFIVNSVVEHRIDKIMITPILGK